MSMTPVVYILAFHQPCSLSVPATEKPIYFITKKNENWASYLVKYHGIPIVSF